MRPIPEVNTHPDNLFFYPMSKERYTIAGVIDPDGTTISVGVEPCSRDDQFVKKSGRALALERALNKPDHVVLIEDGKPRMSFIKAVSSLYPNKYKYRREISMEGKVISQKIVLL